MTCIIGLKDKGKIYFGGDSAVTKTDLSLGIIAERKIFITGNNDYIIGFAGNPRGLQLMKHTPWIPTYHENEWGSLKDYICASFVEELRYLYKNKGYSIIQDNQEENLDQILLGFKNRLFIIGNTYEVIEYNSDFVSIGCGSYHAEGSMHILQKTKLSPERKILEALKVSECYSTGIRGPFYIESI